jgi:hypothetical protein
MVDKTIQTKYSGILLDKSIDNYETKFTAR